ncbi:hypothetical protein BGZ60DRAFT_257863 [Tricladium varicosporioides]|nr:hypothetical protein BGZ60DRAFT_257863 [Hymenoscyphus varicosporioides]
MSGSREIPLHEIWIRRGARQPWRWRVKDIADISKHSRKLVGGKDVEPDDEVSYDALRTIICAIPADLSFRGLGESPYLSTNGLDRGFGQLVDLAIACWNYECSIDENFWNFANQVREEWTTDRVELKPGNINRQQQSIEWMFLAVVFQWEDVFETMSEHVIMRYRQGKKPTTKKRALPKDFRREVSKTRRKYVLAAYDFVHDVWVGSFEPSDESPSANKLQHKIHSHFRSSRLNIDVRKRPKSIDQDLHKRTDPRSLLNELEDSLEQPNVENDNPQPQPRPRSSCSVRSPASRTGRGGHFRSWMVSGVRAGGGMLHNAVRSNNGEASNRGSIESDASWDSVHDKLVPIINNEKSKLQSVKYADSEFPKLRSDKIQPLASELSAASSSRRY